MSMAAYQTKWLAPHEVNVGCPHCQHRLTTNNRSVWCAVCNYRPKRHTASWWKIRMHFGE